MSESHLIPKVLPFEASKFWFFFVFSTRLFYLFLILSARSIRKKQQQESSSSSKKDKNILETFGTPIILVGAVIVLKATVLLAGAESAPALWSTPLITLVVALLIDIVDSKLSQQPWLQFRKFSTVLILLLIGASCLSGYYQTLERDGYEYMGPMRITHVAASKLDLVGKNMDAKDNQCTNRAMVPYVTVGWGKSWGCRTKTDRWNTNHVSYRQCTKILCEDETSEFFNDPGLCKEDCYTDSEAARAESLKCLEEYFDLSRVVGDDKFEKQQPPWADPSWPTLERYGACDGNVGSSASVEDVDRRYEIAHQKRDIGVLFLFLALGLLYRTRNEPLVPGASTIRKNNKKEHVVEEEEEQSIALLSEDSSRHNC